MIDTILPVKVDGSTYIELPQQSTLQRSDKHQLKGSLGTNLLMKGKKVLAGSPENKIFGLAADYVMFELSLCWTSAFAFELSSRGGKFHEAVYLRTCSASTPGRDTGTI